MVNKKLTFLVPLPRDRWFELVFYFVSSVLIRLAKEHVVRLCGDRWLRFLREDQLYKLAWIIFGLTLSIFPLARRIHLPIQG